MLSYFGQNAESNVYTSPAITMPSNEQCIPNRRKGISISILIFLRIIQTEANSRNLCATVQSVSTRAIYTGECQCSQFVRERCSNKAYLPTFANKKLYPAQLQATCFQPTSDNAARALHRAYRVQLSNYSSRPVSMPFHAALARERLCFTSSSCVQFQTHFAPRRICAQRQRSACLSRSSRCTMDASRTKTENPTIVLSAARRNELARVIVDGPVFRSAGLSVSDNGEPHNFDHWLALGAVLEKELGAEASDARVYQYYLPVYFWIEKELAAHRAATEGDSRPLIVGFSCPQGGGKTTMTRFISRMLSENGMDAAIASLDDFYVPYHEQQEIAEKYARNKLMKYRGMPGTHDLPLLVETLDQIRDFCRGGDCSLDKVQVPRYDKTAYEGRGDRAHKEQWSTLRGGVDVMLLEGWCMGFEPLPHNELSDDDLAVVNDHLSRYRSVYDRLDSMLVIEIADMDWVYGWRLQAERATRDKGKPGLSDEQVKDFVGRFMPAYKHYSPGLYNRNTAICEGHELHIKIDQERRPIYR